jgi:hypothetical protein
VLCIDADERVSEHLRESILAALAAVSPAPTFVAYHFARCNRFMGRYLRHGEGYPMEENLKQVMVTIKI